jgi:hypothetical protein
MGDLSDFERGQIFGARLAGASVSNTATLLGVLRATVCEVLSAEDNISEEKQWAKIKSDRKRSLYIEKDCFAKITELLQHR